MTLFHNLVRTAHTDERSAPQNSDKNKNPSHIKQLLQSTSIDIILWNMNPGTQSGASRKLALFTEVIFTQVTFNNGSLQ